jgi:hypothetical protein
MASNAAADSGASFRVAANTSDHRVCGKIRDASLDEVRLLMGISYPDENYRKQADCYRRNGESSMIYPKKHRKSSVKVSVKPSVSELEMVGSGSI